jgi:hypothetical protein
VQRKLACGLLFVYNYYIESTNRRKPKPTGENIMLNYKFAVGDLVACPLNTTMLILGMEFDNCDKSRAMYRVKLNGKRVELWDAVIVEKYYQ